MHWIKHVIDTDGSGSNLLNNLAEDVSLPQNLHDAFAGPHGKYWHAAWDKELMCLIKNEVFGECVPIQDLKQHNIMPIPTLLVF